jgi:transcriptional regulator with XRE-family HTH domain
MSGSSTESSAALLVHAGHALGMSQGDIALLLGVSRRTVSRWTGHGATLGPDQVATLARAVHPKDPQLAAHIAAHGGATLESLGIGQPAPKEALQPKPEDIESVARTLVDAVVCAAAEALDASPRAVRPALLAAFTRARELGLSLETAERTLAASKARPRAKTRGK